MQTRFIRTTDPDATRRVEETEPEFSRFQALLEQAPAGIGFLRLPELVWTYVNPAFVRITGRKDSADFVGKSIDESLPEIASSTLPADLDRAWKDGQPYSPRGLKIAPIHSAGGQSPELYVDFVFQALRDSPSTVDGILVHVADASERELTRCVLEENAESFQLLQASARIGIWEWDPGHSASKLSPELHRLFGTDPADPDHAEQWARRVHPEDRFRLHEELEKSSQTGIMECEYRYFHPQDGLRWFYCSGRRAHRDLHLRGIVQDVTARKTEQEAARRLAAIVESSDDAIVSKNLKGIVTSWNRCAERMFGYTAEEMIGKPITTIIPPDLQDDETRILSTIARGERIEHFETVRVKKNGEPIEVSITVSPVRDEAGRIIGAAKIARDVTQRKKAELALRTSERLASVGRLAATVAHEINNPLESVVNLIYLARNCDDATEIKRFLDLAEEELDRVSHLTRQTLNLYREPKGATNIRIGALVKSVLTVFASRARNKRIRIRTEINDELELCAVPGEIRQVVANLVSNAIDAIDSGGEVRIRVSGSMRWRDGRRPGVRIAVADSGYGISPSALPRLFEPFFTTKTGTGTGLGLWVCKSIVDSQNGLIQVRSSTAPGRTGTVFSVFLPAESSAAEPAPDVAASETRGEPSPLASLPLS
ncbi:MAG TPA: PAS domain S-box protein [Terracidiphilus sp.]|nr:PAS domain S-box protein [Terracidiphilus sp.]